MELDRLHHIDAVLVFAGMSRASLYKRIKEGLFPPPVQVGTRSAWRESSLRAWQAALPTGVRTPVAPPPATAA